MIMCGNRCETNQLHCLIMSNSGKKIGQDDKVHHPKLKQRTLAFQTSDSRTVPTWILANTDRRQRATPHIVLG